MKNIMRDLGMKQLPHATTYFHTTPWFGSWVLCDLIIYIYSLQIAYNPLNWIVIRLFTNCPLIFTHQSQTEAHTVVEVGWDHFDGGVNLQYWRLKMKRPILILWRCWRPETSVQYSDLTKSRDGRQVWTNYTLRQASSMHVLKWADKTRKIARFWMPQGSDETCV